MERLPRDTVGLVRQLDGLKTQLSLPPLPPEIARLPSADDLIADSAVHADVKPWIILTSEWIRYLSILYGSVQMWSAEGRGGQLPYIYTSSIYRTLSGLLAIVDLSIQGMELQTFQLARIVSEDLDVLASCWASRRFAWEYGRTLEPEAAYAFWAARLRGDGAWRHVAPQIGMSPDLDIFLSDRDIRRDETRAFGAAIHPSYFTGIGHLMTGEIGELGLPPWWRSEPQSVGTRQFRLLSWQLPKLAAAFRIRSRRTLMYSHMAEMKRLFPWWIPYLERGHLLLRDTLAGFWWLSETDTFARDADEDEFIRKIWPSFKPA